jgi:hypothetical protein
MRSSAGGVPLLARSMLVLSLPQLTIARPQIFVLYSSIHCVSIMQKMHMTLLSTLMPIRPCYSYIVKVQMPAISPVAYRILDAPQRRQSCVPCRHYPSDCNHHSSLFLHLAHLDPLTCALATCSHPETRLDPSRSSACYPPSLRAAPRSLCFRWPAHARR